MNNTELQNLIINSFLKTFPDSNYYIGRFSSDSFWLSFRLGKPNEWPNAIAENDPLSLKLHYWGEDEIVVAQSSLFLKPTNPLYFGSTFKFRKQTIKKLNSETFDKFFAKIKSQIIEQKENWHPKNIDLITRKVFSIPS